jgi:small-conductance mechanosensitive channel
VLGVAAGAGVVAGAELSVLAAGAGVAGLAAGVAADGSERESVR